MTKSDVMNRLYIVLGVLLILVLGTAFIVPHFIDWSSRRLQMEAFASEALGTPVQIRGDIDFVLLPQPQLVFGDVVIGTPDSPIAEVAETVADFSLLDFLRDQFTITRLVLQAPKVTLAFNAQGRLALPPGLNGGGERANISVADANITGGMVHVSDARSGASWVVDDIAGTLTLSALRGPFGLSGMGAFEGEPYQFRLNASRMNAAGDVQVAAFVRPLSEVFTLNASGVLATGTSPTFAGKATFKMAPSRDADTALARGDLVLEADVEASTDKVRLSEAVLIPDENRAGTRLTGALSVALGAAPRFDAVASGGVVGLAPRDARAETGGEPYEIVRLLAELPAPPIPPIPGTLELDATELDLRAFSLRSVRLDARSDGANWQISAFNALLPGDTTIQLSGQLGAEAGQPVFDGRLDMATDRLDAVAQMWRRPEEGSPLFGASGALGAHVAVSDGQLALEQGTLTLDGAEGDFLLAIVPGTGRLSVRAALGSFDDVQSDVLMALLPDFVSDAAFRASFADVSFDLEAERASLFGLPGSRLAARGTWQPERLSFETLAAGDLGGANFALSGTVSGPLEQARMTGQGHLALGVRARAGLLPVLFERLHVQDEAQTVLTRLLPADLQIELSEPEEGFQALTAVGQTGTATLDFGVNLSNGLGDPLQAPLSVWVELAADTADDLMHHLGVPVLLGEEGEARLVVVADGTPGDSLDAQVTLELPEDQLHYAGSLVVSDLSQLRGRGQVEFDLSDPVVWAELVGAGGMYLPALSGVADLAFSGNESITASALDVTGGGARIRGDISRTLSGGAVQFTGRLDTGNIDLGGLAALMGGPSALLSLEDGVWPDGPFALPQGGRESRGQITVHAPFVSYAKSILASDMGFDLAWDAQNLHLRGLTAAIKGGGTGTLDLTLSGLQAVRQVSGRLTLEEAMLDGLLPRATGRYLDGALSGTLQFSGTGDSLAAVMATLTGQGSFAVAGLSVAGFDPDAFAAVAETENILDLDAAELEARAEQALSDGAFTADEMSGVVSLAGGMLRGNNLAAEADTARLFGGVAVDVSDLGLSGDWTLSPVGQVDEAGLINETTSRIAATLGGTLLAPERVLDLGPMADAIKVRALELEVERLEQLRAEDEARARAAAEERARLMELEAQRQAEEAAAEAAAEAEAERQRLEAEQAAQEAAAQAAQEEAAQEEAEPAPDEPDPIDLLLEEMGESQDPLLNPDQPIDLLLAPPDEGSITTLQ